jgi:hypothetical protein
MPFNFDRLKQILEDNFFCYSIFIYEKKTKCLHSLSESAIGVVTCSIHTPHHQFAAQEINLDGLSRTRNTPHLS